MTDEKRVSIAEKVRFWEEQDKINQALIPRVLEIHDAVLDLHKRTANTSGQIAAAEARVFERVHGEVLGLAQCLEERTAKIGGEIATADARIFERVRVELIGRVRLIAYAALALSALAFALSLHHALK